MNKIIFGILLTIAMPNFCNGQFIFDGSPLDSSTVAFSGSLSPLIIPDTAASPLWQAGLTHKAFFATDTFGTNGIMTDKVNHYPVNANNWFILKVDNSRFNPIVDFWHKYQTDSTHAGGIVEFSSDSGATWQNVKGACNTDGIHSPGVLTSGLYAATDTLLTGEPAFTGVSGGLMYSRVQFFWGLPVAKATSAGCDLHVPLIYLRFRFVSDSTVDSLAGWMIDSIKIEHDRYDGGVPIPTKPESLSVFPNPSYNGSFTFQALPYESSYTIEIYNAMGEKLFTQPYSESVQLTGFPKGLYLYRVTYMATPCYSGQLLRE